MSEIQLPKVRTFHLHDGLGALKVLEEAAECQVAFKEWQDNVEYLEYLTCGKSSVREDIAKYAVEEIYTPEERRTRISFEDELADVLMAAANLAKLHDVDLDAAMRRCEWKNERRGRYDHQASKEA